jgi:hypothetical protein
MEQNYLKEPILLLGDKQVGDLLEEICVCMCVSSAVHRLFRALFEWE